MNRSLVLTNLREMPLDPPSPEMFGPRSGSAPFDIALAEILRSTPEPRLISITSPIGSGKTTALRCLMDAEADRPDGRPVALVTTGDESSTDFSDDLQAALASRARVVAVDNFHRVREPSAQQRFLEAVQSADSTTQFVVAGRHETGPSFASLRPNKLLFELTYADLQIPDWFVDDRLEAFCSAFGPEVHERVRTTAAGWPLAVAVLIDRLATASSEQAEDDRDSVALRIVERASAEIGEYVLAEASEHLSEDDLTFLVGTSVADPLTGSICDAILRSRGSTRRLRSIATRSSVLTSVDRNEKAFRLQPIVRDRLRIRLAESESASDTAARFERAGNRAQEDGEAKLAIGYFTAVGLHERSADLVAALRAEDPTALDPELRRVLDQEGLDEYLPHLLTLALDSDALDEEAIRSWRDRLTPLDWDGALPHGYPSLDRALVELDLHLPHLTETEIRHAIEVIEGNVVPAANPRRRQDDFELAYLHYLLGHRAEARRAAERAVLGHRSIGQTSIRAEIATVLATDLLSQMASDEGLMSQAMTHAEHSEELMETYRLTQLPGRADLAHVFARAILAPTTTEKRLRLERLRDTTRSDIIRLFALTELVRIHDADGDTDGATALLDDALAVREPPPLLRLRLERLQRCLPDRSLKSVGPATQLTPGERALLLRLPGDRTQAELAADLDLSINTIKSHLRGIYQKLGAKSRTEAIARASEEDLLVTVMPWSDDDLSN